MRKRYLRKPYTVEAEQWTGHNLNDDDSLFQDARIIIRNDGKEFIATTPVGIKVAVTNDWLVRYDNGDLAVVSAANFKIKYQPVIEHTTFDPAKGTDEPA